MKSAAMVWEFRCKPDSVEAWHWVHTDDDDPTAVKNSKHSFATLYECARDAQRHGYTGPSEIGARQPSGPSPEGLPRQDPDSPC